jgi:hypothetical protein
MYRDEQTLGLVDIAAVGQGVVQNGVDDGG